MKRSQGTATSVATPLWEYIGGQEVVLDGSQKWANLPEGTEVVEVRAEGNGVYFEINSCAACQDSPGYVPKDDVEYIGPLANLKTLRLFGKPKSRAHLIYYRET
jgi:hypothetical protein